MIFYWLTYQHCYTALFRNTIKSHQQCMSINQNFKNQAEKTYSKHKSGRTNLNKVTHLSHLCYKFMQWWEIWHYSRSESWFSLLLVTLTKPLSQCCLILPKFFKNWSCIWKIFSKYVQIHRSNTNTPIWYLSNTNTNTNTNICVFEQIQIRICVWTQSWHWDTFFATLYINVLGDFDSFPSIITERECDEYITFSHNFMIHSMGKLGA